MKTRWCCLVMVVGWLLGGVTARANWVAFQENADIAYLLFHSPARVERYDLAGRTWLTPLNFGGTATAMHVEDTGLYLAFGGTVRRYTLAGTGEQHLVSVSSAVERILSWNNFLYLSHPSYPYGNFLSLDKTTGAAVSTTQILYDAYIGASLSPTQGKIYGRDQGLSPDDIQMLTLHPDGTFGASVDSPYHGTFPWATNTFVFTGGNLVGDNSGTVYSAVDLVFAGSFGGPVEAIAYDGSRRVILRDRKLIAYSEQFTETGNYQLTVTTPRHLAVRGGEILVFHTAANTRGADVTVVPLDQLQPDPPAPAVDPNGLAFTPDHVLEGPAGSVYLYSKAHANLFPWSSTSRAYGNSIPLVRAPDAPNHVAYSATNHRLYLAYASGRMDQIRLAESSLQQPFAVSPQEPIGLATAGEFVFVCDRASPWVTHYVYHPDGTRLDSRDWNYFSRDYVWNAATRRMYFFRDDTSPNDLHFEEITVGGLLGAEGETPYHGEVATQLPIRPNAGGGFILLGSGQIYDAPGLNRHPFGLANNVHDAVWLGQQLFTIREISGLTQVQSWQTNDFGQATSAQLSGTPLRLVSVNDQLLAITKHLEAPRFYLLDQNLVVQFASTVAPAAPANLAAADVMAESVELAWTDLSDNEDAFLVEIINAGSGDWSRVAQLPPGTTTHTVTGLAPLTYYDLRVLATNSAAASDPAGPITVRTLPDPRSPLGPPFELAAWRVQSDSVELVWRDNASNEDGFRLERKRPVDSNWSVAFESGSGVTGYLDTAVTAATTYLYRIRAFNDFSDSELSSELTVTTLNANAQPPTGPPLDLQLVSAAARSVTIGWWDNSVNEDGFIVERREGVVGPFTEVGRAGINATMFTDPTVEPAQSYQYRVRAFNGHGESANSDGLQVLTPELGGTFLELTGRLGNIAYFAFDGPSRVERFDLAAGEWLESRPLPERPTALLVHSDGVYAAFGRRISRFNHQLGEETHLASMTADVTILAAAMDFLYARGGSGTMLVINRTTGQLVTEADVGYYGWYPRVAVGETVGKLFARTASVSPSDIQSVVLNPDGTFGPATESPYHGDYPGASGVWIFPDESRVVDSAGILYHTSSLTYGGSLAGPVNDIAFLGGDVPIVLRNGELIAYSNLLLETGRRTLTIDAVNVFLEGDDLYVFGPSPTTERGLVVETVPLNTLNPAEPGAAPQLYGLPFTPDDAFLDVNNVLHLFSREHRALFRWNATTRAYLDGIALLGGAEFAAYSPANHRVYLGREPGQVSRIDLAGDLTEVPFVNLPDRILGLAAAGDLVFTCDSSGAWVTHSVFAADGTMLASRDWSYYSREFVWNPATRRLYFFRDDTSPNDLLFEGITTGGQFGNVQESPYHGGYSFTHPLRVRPDGALVVIGSGNVFDGASLSHLAALPNVIVDAAWRGTVLHTIREIAGLTQVQRWSSTHTLTSTVQFNGTPLWLLPQASGFLLITKENGQPRISVLNESLTVLHQTPLNAAPTAVGLANASFPENLAEGAVVSQLVATDPNPADQHTFSLTGGDVTLVRVEGSQLVLAQSINHEARPTVTVTVRAVDPYGLSVEQTVVLTVTDVNEPPTAVHLSNATVLDNALVGAVLGSFSVSDPDDDLPSYVLVNDAGGRFRLLGAQLQVNAPLSGPAAHSITVRATDPGGLTIEQSFVITVERYLPPPPLGEVVLRFEGSGNGAAPRWEEAGFLVAGASGGVSMSSANAFQAVPASGSGHLRQSPPHDPLLLTHLSGQKFRLFSLRLAELNADGRPRTVVLTGRRTDASRVVFEAWLDGAADGIDGIQDFQSLFLPDTFRELLDVTLEADGMAIDDVSLHVGAEPGEALVRLIPHDLSAYENPTGLPDSPPYPHTAWVALTRLGPLAQALTCQLSLSGTALPAFDYVVEGMNADRTVTFQAGQRTVWLQLYPFPDAVTDPDESAVITIEPGPYTRSLERQATVVIRDGLFAGWVAERWPGLSGAAPEMGPAADPDGNGMSNFAEWFAGFNPLRPDESGKPQISVVDAGQLAIHFQQSRMAEGFVYVVEVSSSMNGWTAVSGTMEEMPAGSLTRSFRLLIPFNAGNRFYRCTLQPSSAP